jgi:aspartate racemase
MKTLGLIGGMSWESTVPYYRIINQAVRDQLGGLNSAKLLLASMNFEEVAALQRAGNWTAAGEMLANAALGLAHAGAQAIVICTNTMHLVADAVQQASGVPLLHIGDATGQALRAAGETKVGFIGTRFSMEQPFLHDYLAERYGVELITPGEADRTTVHEVIFNELCQGVVSDASRQRYQEVMAQLVARGAQGIVLGCTEISLLVSQADASVPLFDTGALHARYAARWSLNGGFQ